MSRIAARSTLEEIATLVSEALEEANVPAVLSGGGAVALYSDGRYLTADIDFVTVARSKTIAPIVAELGYAQRGKDFVHEKSQYLLEFPPGPLSFGDKYFDSSEAAMLETRFGHVRIVSPTQCVMDRLAWHIHGNDPQAYAQAVMVARAQIVDWKQLRDWARSEGADEGFIDKFRSQTA